jgi:glyoxylase-like metal-dependent hydrolase (beta-lactamase superfamily II)
MRHTDLLRLFFLRILKYYLEILENIGADPKECAMVGNDVTGDMIAATLGMHVFLLTDDLINKKDAEHLIDPKKSLAEGNFPEHQYPVSADIFIKDGDIIKLGKEEIKVMSTPGHTEGSVCYILEKDRVIISGDTLFCMTAGRTDFPGGSDEKMIESLKRLIALEGDYAVLPGHNRETTLESERKRNWYIRRMVK